MKSTERIRGGLPNRRTFLGGAATGLLASGIPPALLSSVFASTAAGPVESDTPKMPSDQVNDYDRSWMFCAPNTSGIWVRFRVECFCRLIDNATGNADEFGLATLAKTGLVKDPKTGTLLPGYDYVLIFTRDTIYTRRSHATYYARNPTTLTLEDFGPIGWHLQPVASPQPLTSASDVKQALHGWKRMTASTEFKSADGKQSYIVQYPVKWADCGEKRDSYRVETGPIVLLDPDRVTVGKKPMLDDFRWAHVDFHSPDSVRLLLDKPTSILSEATYFPPKEDKREARENPPLTEEQKKAIEDRLFSGWTPPVSEKAMRELFTTDHYSDARDVKVVNKLWAFD